MNPVVNFSKTPKETPGACEEDSSLASNNNRAKIVEAKKIAELRISMLDPSIAPTIRKMSESPIIIDRATDIVITRVLRAILKALGNDNEHCIINPNPDFYTKSLDQKDPKYPAYEIFRKSIESIPNTLVPNSDTHHMGSIGIFGENNLVNIYVSKDWLNNDLVFDLTIQKIQGIIDRLGEIADKGNERNQGDILATENDILATENIVLKEENSLLTRKSINFYEENKTLKQECTVYVEQLEQEKLRISGLLEQIVANEKQIVANEELIANSRETYNLLVLENKRLREENDKLLELASTDQLTKISNRFAMEEQFAEMQKDTKPVHLLLLDIDYFKDYNTKHGHNGGDLALIEFAMILTRAIRKFANPEEFTKEIIDISGKKVLTYFNKSDFFKNPENITEYLKCFNIISQKQKYDIDGYYPDFSVHRLGGEEFVILLNGGTLDFARELAEYIRSEIASTSILMPENINDSSTSKFENTPLKSREESNRDNETFISTEITASIGLAKLKKGDTLKNLLGNADNALYRAKNNGRNRVEVYGEGEIVQKIITSDSSIVDLPKGRRSGERGAIPGKITVKGDDFEDRRTKSRRGNRMGNPNDVVTSFQDLHKLHFNHVSQ